MRAALLLSILLLSTALRAEDTMLSVYPQVRLPAADTPQQKTIALGKLARIVAERGTRRELSNLPVSTAVFTGRHRVRGEAVIRALRRVPELAGAEIVGPEWVSVGESRDGARASQVLAEARRRFSAHIDAAWPGQYRNIQLTAQDQPAQLPISTEATFSFDFSRLQQLRKRTPVWLEVAEHGRAQRVPLWFKVSGEALVWESLQSLEARESVHEEQFLQRWRRLDTLPAGALGAPAEGQRLVTPLPPGAVLLASAMEPVPDVEYGRDTVVISRVGKVQIQTLATALRTAFAGDVVELRSKSSQQLFSARVLEKNLVEIETQLASRQEPVGEE